MSPLQAAARIDRFAAQLPEAMAAGIEAALKLAKQRAIWWSSGPLSQADQRRMGAPYARAERGQERPDPGQINIRGGAVVSGWAFSPPESRGAAGGSLSRSLYNVAPHARFLYDENDPPKWPDRGTRAMVGRPLPERVMAEVEPRLPELFGAALDKIMGTAGA